jgi:hypothetical protein
VLAWSGVPKDTLVVMLCWRSAVDTTARTDASKGTIDIRVEVFAEPSATWWLDHLRFAGGAGNNQTV